MTDLDALDRAFLKGSGVPSLPNKGKSAVVDPIDAAFMRGLGQTPTAEVANTPRRVPFTPTPVSPRAMAGAIIRGAGEGLVQGARDLGVTAGKSIIGVGETAVGLLDIASAPVQAIFSKLFTGRVQLGQVGKLLEDIGVDFKTTQDILSTLYSDEQKQALQNVSEKKSAKEKLVALGANPTVPIHSVLQSIPSMMASASGSEKLVRLGMSKWLAGALGEGAVQASSAQEQYRQQSDTGYTTPKQTSLAVASGLVTAAIAAASGKISEKIGLEDVESIGASGSSRGSNLEFWKRVLGGMFMEGPVEEGFQSSTEKIAENLALGRPWDEGVEGAYTEGSVSGAIIGAVANALPSKGKSKTAPTLDADAWIKENADMLPTIAAKEKLSRNDWQKLGLPRVPEAERAAFLQKVKDTVAEPKFPMDTAAEPKFPAPGSVLPQPAKDALLPKPSGLELPLNEETKARIQKVRAEVQAELDAPTEAEAEANKPVETPVVAEAESVAERKKGKRVPKAPVPEANAAVDEVQAELDAQTAEDAADEAAYALFGKREAKTPVPDATAAPVEPEATVPTDTAAEVVKPVEERKKGKRVPKAKMQGKKVKGVVEPVVEAPVVKESLSTPVEQPQPTVADVAAKEPWEMTREEYYQHIRTVESPGRANNRPSPNWKKVEEAVGFGIHGKGDEVQPLPRQRLVGGFTKEQEETLRVALGVQGYTVDKIRVRNQEEQDIPAGGGWRARARDILPTSPEHERSVRAALADNHPVPANVLAEYPELANAKPRKDAEQAETIEGRFIKQLPSGRWVVQSEENRQRAERGEREIGGDRLFASREEAVKETKLEIEIDRRNAALKATEAAAQAEREAAAAKREAPLNAYLDTLTTTPLQRGKLKTTLSKQVARRVSSTGKVYSGSKFEVVNQMVGDGFKADAVEVDAIKDVSRVQWNRMDERQQREWDARRKAAGKKTEYRLVGADKSYYVVTKVEHDLAKAVETSSSPTAPIIQPYGDGADTQAAQATVDLSRKLDPLKSKGRAKPVVSTDIVRHDGGRAMSEGYVEPEGVRVVDDVPKQPTAREVKTGLKGQTKTVPVEIPTNGEPTTTIVGRMDMAEFERMGYEPDEVTRQNWVDLQRAERRRLGQREEGDNPNAPWAEYEEFHRDSVKRSLAKGDVVDERVLADYPELQTHEVKTGRKGVTKEASGESVLPSAANAEQAGKGYAIPGAERLRVKGTASGWSVWVGNTRVYRNLKKKPVLTRADVELATKLDNAAAMRRAAEAAEKAASEQATRDDYEAAGLREMSIKPTAAQVKNWFDGTYKGKPVYSSSGHFIDLSGTEPHLKGWADRRDPTRTHIGEEAVENIVHSASNQSSVMKLEPVALNDAPTLASKKLAVFSRIDSQTAVYVDLKHVSYFLSKFKGAELYTGEPNKSGGYAAIQVRHGGDLVGILMPIHLMEDAHTPIEIRGFMKASGKDVAKPKSVVQRAKEAKEATASPEAAVKAEADVDSKKPNSALASSVAKAKAEGNDIELVDTVSDLPSDIRSQLRSDTSNIEGFYVNGKTYIIGENVTPDRAEAAVREEMAHRKLDTAQGEELIDGFKKRMTEKDRKALIKEGYTKTQGESDADYEARLANEFIAKQARKNTSAWTEFVDSVKAFLESVGVRDLTSEEAARVILRKLRGGAATGKGVRYSLTPAAELDEAKYESAKGIFGTKLERLGEAGFRKWVAEKLPDSAMPYAERFLSERSAMATVPKKKFVTGISRKVVDAELEAMGKTPSEGGGQPSWPQLMAQAKADIKANSSAGDSLIANLVKNPRPLTAEEIALLNHVKVQRWNERDAAYKSGDKNRLEVAEARMEEVYFVSTLGPDKSKSMMGGALNALKMMTDEKYELVNLVQSHYATTGDVAKPGSQVYKDLEAIAQQYKERTEVLERENARLQEEATTMSQSLADAIRQAAYNQGKPKSKGKSKAAKIASVADVISKKSRDYGMSLIEQARKEQAALNMRASAGVDPARLLMLSKFAAGHIMLGVSDVSAKVSEFYGSKITSAEMAQIMSEANKIVLDARNRFAKEAESETLASRVIPKGKGAKTATQLSEVSLKDMFREQAENGVKTFKEALPLVGKLVRASGINATDLQIQDTYDSYINEPGVLSTDTIKKITAAYRQEAQLLSKINDAKKGVRPHKIGVPRFPSSQEARALEKELDDLMKNVTFSGDKKPTDIASPLDAKKTWMQNEIDDMEKAIALHEERFQGEKGITDQGDVEYQRLKAQLEDVRKRYAEAFPKKPLTQEEQLAILIKQEEKNVDRWNKRVADAKSGKFKSYERVQRPYSERLAELQYQRDNAKAEVARLYELQNPGKRAREAQMRRDLAAIKEMERRMAAGDYTTPTKTTLDLSGDPDAMAAHVAREQTKKTYEQYKARAAWNKLTPGRKLLIVAKNLLMSDKAFVYSADDSYPGRQGWTFALTHPKKWFKTSKRGLSAASSKNSAQIIQEIKENELYKSGVLKAAGLNINVKDATGQYESVDDASLEFVNKIPVYGEVTKVSGRMFGATANLQRLEFLTTILEGSKFGRKILADPYHRTDAQNEFLKHVGWGVNVFTGFAGNNIIKPGLMLGAPNWVFSVLLNFGQVPMFNALFDGDWKAAAALEKQYGRFYLATLSLIAAMSLLPSGPKDDEGKRKRHRVVLDPRNVRVGIGYIPYTAVPINVFGPLAPWIRFVGMNVTGQKIVGGEIINLRNSFLWTHTEEQKAKGVPWKGEQWREDLRFLRGKFRPLVTTAMGLRDGLSYDGKETPRLRLLFEAYQPLTPLHFIENLARVPPEQAAAETLMEFFGFNSKPDFNTPQYKKYEAKMKVVDEMFKLKFKDENGKSFGDRAEDIYIANAMKTLHRATDTDSSLGLQESAKMMIDDLGLDACLVLLYHQARAKSLSMGSTKEPTERTKDGNLTAYGKRVQKLRIISAQ